MQATVLLWIPVQERHALGGPKDGARRAGHRLRHVEQPAEGAVLQLQVMQGWGAVQYQERVEAFGHFQ